jgi:hypothetical protein
MTHHADIDLWEKVPASCNGKQLEDNIQEQNSSNLHCNLVNSNAFNRIGFYKVFQFGSNPHPLTQIDRGYSSIQEVQLRILKD